MNLKELQAIKGVIRDVIRSYEFSLSDIKREVSYLYKNSTPDTTSGKGFFRLLNSTQNEKRKLQSKLKKLRALQVSLKKEIIAENEYLNFDNNFDNQITHLINTTFKD